MSDRNKYLIRTYGITLAEYEDLLDVFDGKCWGCGREPKPGRNLHVDHDHKTREVRALLCWSCNHILRPAVTEEQLEGLAKVKRYGTNIVRTTIGHSGECAPVKRRTKKGR